MPRYPIVLLDADNTLFDFDAAERRALRCVLRAHGFPTDRDTVEVYRGINAALWDAFARGEVEQSFLFVERFRRFLRAVGGTGDPEAMHAGYIAALSTCDDLLPGALEFCARLSARGCALSIVTNGSVQAQRGRYAASPLRSYIPRLFISEEVGARKPDPIFFDRVCRMASIADRRQAVVVGDGLGADILGGSRAGIDTIWFNPRGAPLTGPARPTYTAESYDAAESIISGTSKEALDP